MGNLGPDPPIYRGGHYRPDITGRRVHEYPTPSPGAGTYAGPSVREPYPTKLTSGLRGQNFQNTNKNKNYLKVRLQAWPHN